MAGGAVEGGVMFKKFTQRVSGPPWVMWLMWCDVQGSCAAAGMQLRQKRLYNILVLAEPAVHAILKLAEAAVMIN